MVFTLFFTYRRKRECLGTPFSLSNDFKTKTGINRLRWKVVLYL